MIGIYFHGRRAVRPAVLTHVDTEEMVRAGFAITGAVALIGEGKGGVPGTVYKFMSPMTARDTIKDGDLLTGIEIVFDPAKDKTTFPGASKVLAIRVNPAEQATADIIDVGSVTQIELTSVDYGVDQNQLRYKIEPGTVDTKFLGVDGKKFTLNDTIFGTYEIGDNLGPMFRIQYKGDASTAKLIVSATEIRVTLAGDQTDGSVDLVIDLTKTFYDNLIKVVNYTNTFAPFYEAYVLAPMANTFPSDEFDEVVTPGVDCQTNPVVVTSIVRATSFYIQENSELVTATVVGLVANELQEVGWTYLTGGSEGTTTNTDWQNALDELTKENVSIIVPITEDESKQHLALAHVNYMTSREKKRTMVVGHPLALETAIEDLKNRARALNSSRAVLATPGIYKYDRFGVLTAYSSVFTACCYAGMAISGIVSEPLTYDYINAIGLTTIYTEEQIDEFVLSGISPVEFVEDKGLRIVQGLTTYLQSDNVVYREWSMQRTADELSINVAREVEDSYIGKGATDARIRRVKRTVEKVLKDAAQPEQEIIVAWLPPTVSFENQLIKIVYEVSFVEPINWITITTYVKPARLNA